MGGVRRGSGASGADLEVRWEEVKSEDYKRSRIELKIDGCGERET